MWSYAFVDLFYLYSIDNLSNKDLRRSKMVKPDTANMDAFTLQRV